jgi:acylphosphatase
VTEEKRVRVIVHGYVQGVGFRAACQAEASASGVRGWVKNKWDGSVEALFEGPEEAVDHMIRWCERGPRAADVERIEQREAPEPAPAGPFRIR